MEMLKKNILTLTVLAAVASPIYMRAMNNDAQESQEERKDEAAVAKKSSPKFQFSEAMAPQAAAVVAIPLSEHIEQANRGLIQAVEDNDVEAAQAALNNGANPNICDPVNFCPLLITVAGSTKPEKPEIIELLLIHGATIDTVAYNGLTALNAAIDAYSFRSLKTLLSNHADINRKSDNTITPLLKIAEKIAFVARFSRITNQTPNALIRIAQMLIFADADLTLTNNDGKTVLDILAEEPAAVNVLPTIIKACNIKQTITKILNALKASLQEESYQNPRIPIEELVRLNAADYSIPYYQNDADNDPQEAYELLNERTAEQWARIKAELEAARLLNRYHLGVHNVTDIVLDYLASGK